jgi:hypothetical protein
MRKLYHVLLPALLAFLPGFSSANAQDIEVHEYRKVAPEDMQEYLKRETTYWQKFAQSEVKKGNLAFWGIFQKIGGTDLDNSPNILIINDYPDIDKGVDWSGVTGLFPGVKMENIETGGLSTTTCQIFLRNVGDHIQVENPEFNFVVINYHDVKSVDTHMEFETENWKPMLQKAMDEGKTRIKGWGHGVIATISALNSGYDTYSYDLYSSLKDAILPPFTGEMEFEPGFFDEMMANYDRPRNATLYRVVAAVTQ